MRFLTVRVLMLVSGLVLGVGWSPGPLPSRLEAAELEHSLTAIDAVLTFEPEDVATSNDGHFDHITLRGADVDKFSTHAGQPQLPVVVKWFLLPPTSTVADLRVELAGRQPIPGEFVPLPVPSMDDEDGAPPEAPDWPQQLYPAAPGMVVRVCQARRYQLAKIAIYPLEYQTDGGALRLARQVTIHLSLRDRTPEELRARLAFARPSSAEDPFRVIRNWIASTAVNSADLDRLYPILSDAPREDEEGDAGKSAAGPGYISEWPSTEGQDVPYVIVTNNTDELGNNIGDMAAAFQVHADALTQLGLPAAVRTVSDIEGHYSGFDRPARIRAFIQDAVAQWGTCYVLLGGDLQVVPSRRLGGPNSWPLFVRHDLPADYWYTRVGVDEMGHPIDESWNENEDAWIGETQSDIESQPGWGYVSTIWLGRLPARNAAEAETMVRKVHRYLLLPGYESFVASADFYHTVLTAAGPVHTQALNSDLNGIWRSEYEAVEPLEYTGSPYVGHFIRLYPDVGRPSDTCNAPDPEVAPCYPVLRDYINARVGSPPDYWGGDDLRNALNDGAHLVFHLEHSMRDFLGKPTAVGDRYAMNPSCTSQDSAECMTQLKADFSGIQKLEIGQVEALQNAPDGWPARYSFVLSHGCLTNMIDMDATGEAFMRAPDGGAVAYLGASGSWWTAWGKEETRGLVQRLFSTQESPCQWGPAWFQAVSAAAMDAWHETQVLIGSPQLGDPALWAWRDTPVGFSLSTSTILAGLNNLISVTVHEAGTSTPVEGAVVCLRQGTGTYARAVSDAYGIARFPGIVVASAQHPVAVSAFLPGWKATTSSVGVSGGPVVVYSSNTVDDLPPGGDGDGVPEAGETVSFAITLRNQGTQASSRGTVTLRATPKLAVEIKINGQYRPADTILGRANATAPADADSFQVPLVYRGIRVEGEPTSTSPHERYKVWRNDTSGKYTVAMSSYSASPDSVFSGIIRVAGGLANVTKIGEANDLYGSSADSIWFSFRGDQSEDKLSFSAEAPDWISISPGASARLNALQPGDSATVTLSVTLLSGCPDGQNVYLSVSAAGVYGTGTYAYSDFVTPVSKPVTEILTIERETGDFGCQDTTWRWSPVVWNRGSAEADSVVLRLRKTSGTLTVMDSVVTIVGLPPDSIAQADAFTLCGSSMSDTTGFAATIVKETYHRPLLYDIDHVGVGGGCMQCSTSAPVAYADLIGGRIVLHWTPVNGADGYKIAYTPGLGSPGRVLAWTNAKTLRYEVDPWALQSYDGDVHNNSFSFCIAPYWGCNWGGWSNWVGPIYPWVREHEGWPKLLPETSSCAPMVADLGNGVNAAIFAASDRIYAWREDGTPLTGVLGDSVFFDPDLPERQPYQRFTEALSLVRWPTNSTERILAGNLLGRGTYFIRVVPSSLYRIFSSELICTGPQSSSSCAIATKALGYGPSYLASFLGGTASGVYAWDQDFNREDPESELCNGVLYAPMARSTPQSLAISENADYGPSEDKYLLVAGDNEGWLRGYAIDDVTQQATALWERDLSTELSTVRRSWLSPPAIGDVGGDGMPDVAVTTQTDLLPLDPLQPDTLYILEAETGLPKPNGVVSLTGNSWGFWRSAEQPPAGPALVYMDGDNELSIVVPGVRTGCGWDCRYVTVEVFHYSSTGVSVVVGESEIPYTARNGYSAGPGGEWSSGPIGTPIVGDVDYDGETYKPDIFVTTSDGAIHAFEYDPAGPTITPKPGWPLLLPDAAREPVLTQLDAESDQFQLVVQCQDGWLHVFDLPGNASGWIPAGFWSSYGGDNGNTRGRWFMSLKNGDGAAVEDGVARPRITAVSPIPSRSGVTFDLATRGHERVTLEIVDVSGRVVRRMEIPSASPGRTVVNWNGLDDRGQKVASGVYWGMLRGAGASQARRLVVLH